MAEERHEILLNKEEKSLFFIDFRKTIFRIILSLSLLASFIFLVWRIIPSLMVEWKWSGDLSSFVSIAWNVALIADGLGFLWVIFKVMAILWSNDMQRRNKEWENLKIWGMGGSLFLGLPSFWFFSYFHWFKPWIDTHNTSFLASCLSLITIMGSMWFLVYLAAVVFYQKTRKKKKEKK